MIPAVVLSSHVIGLGVIRSLGFMKVPIIAVVYDTRDMGYRSKYVTRTIFAPHPEEWEEKFIDLLIQLGRESKNNLLIPADDATLKTVSKYKSQLMPYFLVAATEWDITQKFLDKKFTYSLAESAGVAVPRTFAAESIPAAKEASKLLSYPFLLKPCLSHKYVERFGEKMTLVENQDQLLRAYQRAKEASLEVMLQEFIPGDDTQGANYNAYFWDEKAITEFTAQKVRLSPPAFGIPRVVMSKSIPEIIKPGRAILKAMGFYGYCCVEFKRDVRDGVYKLMEVNGRFNRSILLSNRCDINFPWLMYNHLMLGNYPSARSYRQNVYWIDLTQDISKSLWYFRAERYHLKQYLKPYQKSHIFAIWDIKDPLPFLKRCFDLVKIALKAAFRLIKLGEKPATYKSTNEDSGDNLMRVTN